MENIYRIPVQYMEDFEKKIEKLNKRAKKLNLDEIKFNILDTIMVEKERFETLYEIPCYEVEIFQGQEVKIEGYEFVAKLERNIEDSFLYKGDDDVPESQKEIRICQHCNTKRKRNLFYILKNEKNQYITVGKSCLIDYIGHKDAEKIAQFYQDVQEYFITDDSMFLFDHEINKESFVLLTYSINQVIRASIVSVNDRGYHKTDSEQLSTREDVYGIMFGRTSYYERLREKSERLPQSEVDEIIDIILNIKPTSSYIENLHTLIKDKYVNEKHLGYVVSMIPTARKALEEEVKSKIESQSEYVGKIKEKIELLVTFYRSAFYYRTSQYTGKEEKVYIYTFLDEKGNQIVWKTTSSKDFDVDDKLTLKGTVKEHQLYNDVKQTIVNRPTCKYIDGNYKSKHLSNIGDKIEIDVTLEKTVEKLVGQSDSLIYRYEFLDKKKNSIVWETKNKISSSKGDKVKLIGTVKSHEEYKGTKHTILKSDATLKSI